MGIKRMGGKRFQMYLILTVVCCSPLAVATTPQDSVQQPAEDLGSSVVDALGFVIGRASEYRYGHDQWGDFIWFHAKLVLFLAIASPVSCSVIRLYTNDDVQIYVWSVPSGSIGNTTLRIVFKTKVVGPI